MDSLLVFLDLLLFDAWKKFQTYSTLNGGEKWWFTMVESKTSP